MNQYNDEAGRILVFASISDPESTYEQIITLKPPFHYLFVLDSPSDKALEVAAPIPTYYLHTDSEQVDYPDLNLTILPRYGVLNLSKLTVAYVVDSAHCSLIPDQHVDILLTRQFPRGFHRFWTKKLESPWTVGDYAISKLCMALTPRYHFSLGFHAEIPPFRNGPIITRFIGLAPQGNRERQKFRYAFVLNKSSVQPKDLTECPFTCKEPEESESNQDETPSKKMKLTLQPIDSTGGFQRWSTTTEESDCNQPPDGYICRRCHNPGHYINNCPSSRSKSATIQPCWFCLASPNIETHLIVTIGKEVYLALPKGPMHPQHVLIIPIAHVASSIQLSDTTKNELIEYKKAIGRVFQNNVIFYERYIRTRNATHLQIQAIPISPEQMPAMTVKRFIDTAAAENHVQFNRISPEFNLYSLADDTQFILVELGHERVFYEHTNGKHVPLQTVRSVLASMLGDPSLADWQRCQSSVEEETALKETFKQLFAPFDINQ